MTRYNELVFEEDMMTATHDDGHVIHLTRQEHALLKCLLETPKIVVSRDRLLDALRRDDVSDRNVDYIVNRLRRRLGDDSRNPRFVATRYGGGYTWIADRARDAPIRAFLLVGPVFGMGRKETATRLYLDRFVASLRREIPADPGVALRLEPGSSDLQDDVDFELEISTHEDGGGIHLAMILRDRRAGKTVRSFRNTSGRGSAGDAAKAARAVVDTMWWHLSLPAGDAEPAEPPVHLLMHGAASAVAAEAATWPVSQRRLEMPSPPLDEPRIALMKSGALYARLLQSLGTFRTQPLGPEEWDTIEDEIEMRIVRALPHITDPQDLLSAAKLLRFLARGHLEISSDLTERAFAEGTAFAAAFSMKAQIAASRGRVDDATLLYDKAIELAEDGSQFHIYLLVLKIVSLMAADRRDCVDREAEVLFRTEPTARSGFGLFYARPGDRRLHPEVEAFRVNLTLSQRRWIRGYLFRISARQFEDERHRENVMRGLEYHLEPMQPSP